MAKSYRPVLRDQPMLLPIDLREWLPEDHLAWFVLETVEAVDTSGLEQTTRRRGWCCGLRPANVVRAAGLRVLPGCPIVLADRAVVCY